MNFTAEKLFSERLKHDFKEVDKPRNWTWPDEDIHFSSNSSSNATPSSKPLINLYEFGVVLLAESSVCLLVNVGIFCMHVAEWIMLILKKHPRFFAVKNFERFYFFKRNFSVILFSGILIIWAYKILQTHNEISENKPVSVMYMIISIAFMIPSFIVLPNDITGSIISIDCRRTLFYMGLVFGLCFTTIITIYNFRKGINGRELVKSIAKMYSFVLQTMTVLMSIVLYINRKPKGREIQVEPAPNLTMTNTDLQLNEEVLGTSEDRGLTSNSKNKAYKWIEVLGALVYYCPSIIMSVWVQFDESFDLSLIVILLLVGALISCSLKEFLFFCFERY